MRWILVGFGVWVDLFFFSYFVVRGWMKGFYFENGWCVGEAVCLWGNWFVMSRTDKMAADLSRAAPVERDVEQVIGFAAQEIAFEIYLFLSVLMHCWFECEWFVEESGKIWNCNTFPLEFGNLILKEWARNCGCITFKCTMSLLWMLDIIIITVLSSSLYSTLNRSVVDLEFD